MTSAYLYLCMHISMLWGNSCVDFKEGSPVRTGHFVTHSNTNLSFNQQGPYSDFFLRQALIQPKSWGKDDLKSKKTADNVNCWTIDQFQRGFCYYKISEYGPCTQTEWKRNCILHCVMPQRYLVARRGIRLTWLSLCISLFIVPRW